MFDKVLIANRGEIAVRVIRACSELGIKTVAVYSDADEDAMHVRLADVAYNIGPAPVTKSYLDSEAILEAADEADADAIHPGYGFFAENAEFAAKVENSDSTWVGPPSTVMRELGEKTQARKQMAAADVPVVPGTTDPVTDPERVSEFADEHGYPIAIKAAGGGGGKGLKVVESDDEIESALQNAQREGESYFDNPNVYLERYLENPRHIEVQVLADQHGSVRHFGERDCTLQRNQQKLVEETPAPGLEPDLRRRIWKAARRGISEASYTNAGTVEFLVEDGQFYFLEVNTRIQVEHTISEAVTGYDLVKWQLRVAAGEEIDFSQEEVERFGTAIEFRINSEDPMNDFMPLPGPLETYRLPAGIGIRTDDGVEEGDEVSGYYDSMIAKLVVHAQDRSEAIARAKRALCETCVEGVSTTVPFHRAILEDETFLENQHSTKYVDEEMDTDAIEAYVNN